MLKTIKSNKNFLFIFISISLVFLYLPTFLGVFAAHTDGFLFLCQKGNWLSDPESGILMTQGRPFLAFINSFIGWFITDVHQLSLLRLFIFLIQALSAYYIFRFLLRLEWSINRSLMFVLVYLMLPLNIINNLWISNGLSDSLSIFLSFISYFFLNQFSKTNKIVFLIVSAVIFFISVLTYQPTAVIVFSLIFIRLLFENQLSWSKLRRIIIFELLFYVFILIGYWVFLKTFLIPFTINHLKLFPTNNSMYQMDLAGNLFNKIPLILNVIRYGLLGTWDLILHEQVILQWGIVVGVGLGGIGILIGRTIKKQFKVEIVQKFILCSVLFIAGNAPALMAVNYTRIVGYRTLMPASLCGIAILFFLIRFIKKNSLVDLLIWILVAVNLVIGFWMLNQAVINYSREYNYINRVASHIDYKSKDKVLIILNIPGSRAVDVQMPFEFGYMVTNTQHLQYVFDKYTKPLNKKLEFIEVYPDWRIFLDNKTEVLDLTGYKKNKIRMDLNKKILRIIPDSPLIKVVNIAPGSSYPVFAFFEQNSEGKIEPWSLKAGVKEAKVDLSYLNNPEAPLSYRIEISCQSNLKDACGFSWSLLGSNVEGQWEELSSMNWGAQDGNTKDKQFNIFSLKTYKNLRLNIQKQEQSDVLYIKGLQLISIGME